MDKAIEMYNNIPIMKSYLRFLSRNKLYTAIMAVGLNKSQVTWMQDNYKDTLADKNFLEQYYTIARYRGLQCGVEYAEGFRMANDAFRVAPYRVLP